MRFIIFTFGMVIMLSAPVKAQEALPADPSYRPVTSDRPICFFLRSDVPHSIFGTIMTNYSPTADGGWARHKSNFRLDEGERSEVCTSGPFYEEGTIRVTVKTLIPLMSCLYRPVQGDTLVFEEKRLDDGETRRIVANCFITYPRDQEN